MNAEIYLTQDEREAVAAQRPRLYGSRNCERTAVVLRPREDGEVDIVYAISRMKRVEGRPAVCEVQAVALGGAETLSFVGDAPAVVLRGDGWFAAVMSLRIKLDDDAGEFDVDIDLPEVDDHV